MSGFNLSHLDTEGFGGIWDFFFSNHQEAVKIFREKNISGRYLSVLISINFYLKTFLELFHNVSTVARLDEIIEHMVLVHNEDITILPPPQIYPVTYFPSYKFVIDPRSYSKFRYKSENKKAYKC